MRNQKLARGCLVRDRYDNNLGIVVKIEPGTSHEDHGTVFVWQLDRMDYGADNCEHYPEYGWELSLEILEGPESGVTSEARVVSWLN